MEISEETANKIITTGTRFLGKKGYSIVWMIVAVFWVLAAIILVLIDGYFVIGFSYLLFLVNWSNFFATSLVKILLETDDMVLLLLSAVEDISISDNNKMALDIFFSIC